ncbi:4Fe-4S dicluster domain-containing protein [Caldanaerobius polysaccharolyticus]|uniref:4Fe-4S dicluster domain-containing protein n=1 Tax=Caldanaerobius polysaccharolyticus TaxID=44256 RepID=UPI00047C67D8|nr:4Fe-4S dicluster domain-containing protein [Caldanaerobius polysaccharolyticus]
MKGKVTFKQDLCKGCELCTTVCPVKIVKMSDKLNAKGYHPSTVDEADMPKCIGCAFCAMICPDCAIEVERL